MEVQAFLIALREGVEALLIVGIITSYLHRIEQHRYTRWVWAGTFAALLCSIAAAFILQLVLVGFAMMNAEVYLKAGIMFVASILLGYMVFWMAKQGREEKGQLQGAIDEYVSTGNVFGMVILAFSGVLREGVETVFFFAAISRGDLTAAFSGWGAISGLALAALICWLLFRGAVRVPLSTFFRASGIFLLLIAAGMFSQGVSMLQDLGIIGSLYPHVYNITWLLPEHPVDAAHFIRETGHAPLISAQVGVFLRALFGYAAMPSIEEIVAYFGFYAVIFGGLRLSERREASRRRRAHGATPAQQAEPAERGADDAAAGTYAEKVHPGSIGRV